MGVVIVGDRAKKPPGEGFGAWFDILRTAARDWMADKAPRLGAAVAFYSMLSLAPLLIISIALVGVVFGEGTAREQIIAQFRSLVGPEGAQAVAAMIEHARKPGAGLLASLLGVVALLFGASGVFGELRDALNTIWEAKPRPSSGIWGFVRDRILSFGMVLVIGFLLLISLVISTVLAGLGSFAAGRLPAVAGMMEAINFVVSLGVSTLLFALIYQVLPDAEVAWRDVWVGAAITAVLFVVGKLALGLYLGKAGVGSPYGAAGSLVVLLIWIYYSAQILFFGAEVTQVYANRFGSRIVSRADAAA